MLSSRGPWARHLRPVVPGLGLLLVASLLSLPTPARAAPAPGSSAIGDGASSSPSDYVDATTNTDPDTDVHAGDARDDACQQVAGSVSAADKSRYRGSQPSGEGQWEYRLCAETAAVAGRAVAAHPDVAGAKAYCAALESRCAVVVYWNPKQKQKDDVEIRGRMGYFQSFFRLAPDLETSPSRAAQYGLVVNLPTWYWDRTRPEPKPVYLPVFGGIWGVAIHLGTKWNTDGTRICSVPGTVYRPGRYPPTQESPNCGHTYRSIGQYDVRGCKTWLIVAYRPPWFLVVFPVTLCRTWNVPVLESQVVTGGDPRRARVG